MTFSASMNLHLHSVVHRGVPNQERIAFQAMGPVNLSEFGVFLAVTAAGGGTFPITDNHFWFGHGTMQLGDWMMLYTGTGQPTVSDLTAPFGPGKLYARYWGRSQTAFFHPSIVPVLYRLLDVEILPGDPFPLPLPQGQAPAVAGPASVS